MLKRLALIAFCSTLAGCAPTSGDQPVTPTLPPVDMAGSPAAGTVEPAPSWAALPAVANPDRELAQFGSREQRYATFCSANKGDAFFKRLCGGVRPRIADMAGLLKLLGLEQNRAFALTANSTSLVAMSVSALNPRIIIFPRIEHDFVPAKELIAVGFVRGEQFVEIVSGDRSTGELNFYLLSFEQSCNYQPAGCSLADLLTQSIERDWTAYSVFADNELENTSFDCLNCHRPGGVGTKKLLRMQELTSPWLHWFPQRFSQRTDSDRVLMARFQEVHGVDEQYGGVPIPTIVNALDEGSGAQLEALVRAEGFADQPNAFDPRIGRDLAAQEVHPSWNGLFDKSVRGEAIAVPYPHIEVTDEAKRVAATLSYVSVVKGEAPRESLLDIREVFSSDAREKLSFVPRPGTDGRTVLLQMCARCHDGRGEPSLSRNLFNVKALDQMQRSIKDLAIARLKEPLETRMPPWRVGSLSEEALQAAIAELSK
jgi:hypothetical protein